MGVFLKCELSMVAKTGNNKAQFPEQGLLIAPELECCPYWQKCLIACGVNPVFHHKISRPPTLPNHLIFGVIESL